MEEFSFPFPPYEIQTRLMREIKGCIEKGQVGVFESPTGTGKSLSVICSTMTWLEQEEEMERRRLEDNINRYKEDETEGEKGEDWVAAYKKKLEKNKDKEESRDRLEYLRKVEERLRRARENTIGGRKRRAQTGKEDFLELEKENGGHITDDDELAPPEVYNSDEENNEREEEVEKLKVTKIYYASRTHSQLEQIVEELQKTRFRPRVVTAASRQTLCANEDVKNLKMSHLINEKCMELRKGGGDKKKKEQEGEVVKRSKCKQSCSFFKSDSIEEVTNGILAAKDVKPMSVFEKGQQAVGCPYFASRNAIPLCQLVLLPYQVALHAETRAAWDIDLKGNVLVLDEAHNVLQTVGSLYSAELTLAGLTVALKLIRQYIETYRLRLKAKNLLYMRHLCLVVEKLERYLRSDTAKDPVFTIQALIIQLILIDVNLFKLVHYIKQVDLCKKFHGFYLRFQRGELKTAEKPPPKLSGIAKLQAAKKAAEAAAKGVVPAPPPQQAPPSTEDRPIPSPLFAVKQFLEALCNKCEDGRIIIEKTKESVKYRFILLNPGAKLVETIREARATVLVGGTMEPSALLIDCLQRGGVKEDMIRRFTCTHVIGDDQLCAVAISETIDCRSFTLTYQTRNDPQLIRSLGLTLEKLISTVPNGAVAFFPSYDYLAFFIENMKKFGLFAKLQDAKNILVEERGPSTALWDKFAVLARSQKGALLCAVVGGKLSEGINFSDDLGRAVFMIGLPYPNRNSVELKEKMKFLDSSRPGAGAQLYESLCMHSVNQAIGRAIRHRNDYAAVFLLDSRFSSVSVSSQLSAWIGCRLVKIGRASEAVRSSVTFFSHKKK